MKNKIKKETAVRPVKMVSYKFKLMLTMVQVLRFSAWAGACRFLQNLCLEHRILSWSQYKLSVSGYDQSNSLKEIKKTSGFEWIGDVPAQCLQQAIMDLDKSFKSFWQSGFGFPKFKRRGQGDSFRFPDSKQFSVRMVSKKKAFIKLPKIGEVAFRYSRKIEGVIKNATIKRESDGWYVSFCCEHTENEVSVETPKTGKAVGIDRGISESIVLSNGRKPFVLPENCFKLRSKIAKKQKLLRNKKKFSSNWKKANKQIAKLHKKIVRTRLDFLHKTSTTIVKNHDLVVLENLKIKNMSKSAKGSIENPGKNVAAKSGLNREIIFQGWGMFENMLRYKLGWKDGELELVDPKFTSQRCSECLYRDAKNRKGKKFECLNCGHEMDADLNAAINIENKSQKKKVRAGRVRRVCGDDGVGHVCEAETSSVEAKAS